MTERDNQEKLQELINKLESLSIQQEKLTKDILEVKEEVNRLTKVNPKIELVEGSGFCLGDSVKITNPKQNQFTTGIVSGKTKNHLIKVKSTTGQVIRRLPKNLKREES